MPVVVVIPTHNSVRWIDGCLASIADAGATVQIVDNASSDGTVERVRERWPDAAVEVLDDNRGYGAAVNLGASRWPGHDVLALNVDTEVEAGAVQRLSSVLRDDSSLGAVTASLHNPDGSSQQSTSAYPSIGSLASALLVPGGATRSHPTRDSGGVPTVIDWAAACALLVRREAWDEVRGFDPAFRFYVEDVDLQRRLFDAGWLIAIDPAAVVTHFGGSRPIPAERFALSHDGWERYFGVRSGRFAQFSARALLILTALGRSIGWLSLSVRPQRRQEAQQWARMFAAAAWISLKRLPGACLRVHKPYAG